MRKERAGGWTVIAVVVALAVLVGGGWAAAYYLAGDELPHGTEVAGVDIGDQTSAQAEKTLESELGDRLEQPVTIVVGERRVVVDPAEAGLQIDYAATVAQAGGEHSWDPRRLWEHYTGGTGVEAVVSVDQGALDAIAAKVEKQAGTAPVDGSITFTSRGVVTTEPELGRGVETEQLRDALVGGYLAEGEERTVEVEQHEVAPDIDAADVDEARRTFANPAMTAPVTLVFGKSPVTLSPADYSAALAMTAEDGALVPTLRSERLRKLVDDAVSGDASQAVDATVRLVDGKPKVVPAKPGVTYSPADIEESFLALVVKPEGQRRMKVPSTVAEPDVTTAEARKLGINRRVSTFTTHYPHAEYRNVNIGRAAELVDGTVLQPGETFSMNDIVGERTLDNGFTAGYVISDGVLKQDLGGGVSQMATTLFNAMFFAGLEDVEHKPHSFYIDRYPVGREATVVWGALDLRFKNNTDHGVLVDTEVVPSTYSREGAVTVSLYSTKTWDIESVTGERYNYRSPATRVIWDDPACEPHTGWSGFDIDVTRVFRKPGSDAVVDREVFHTAYTASDSVECRTTPKPPAQPQQPRQPGQQAGAGRPATG